MIIPNGGALKVPLAGANETIENVAWGRDTSRIITSSPFFKPMLPFVLTDRIRQSIKHGSKTEQCLATMLLHGAISNKTAKKIYDETRLTRRVADLITAGFNIGYIKFRYTEAEYFLSSDSIVKSQNRINELRLSRKTAPINWGVSA